MGEDSIRLALGLLELPDELLLDITCRLRGGDDLQATFISCRKLHEVMVPRIGSAFIELREADADHGLEDGSTQLQVSAVANQIERALPRPEHGDGARINPNYRYRGTVGLVGSTRVLYGSPRSSRPAPASGSLRGQHPPHNAWVAAIKACSMHKLARLMQLCPALDTAAEVSQAGDPQAPNHGIMPLHSSQYTARGGPCNPLPLP